MLYRQISHAQPSVTYFVNSCFIQGNRMKYPSGLLFSPHVWGSRGRLNILIRVLPIIYVGYTDPAWLSLTNKRKFVD